MIYDSLKHMEAYQGVHPGIYKGLELLRDTDFSKLEDARVEVDGEDLFYLLQSYESKPANDTPEAHKKYVDIQFLISGREKMGVGALEDMKEEVEAHPEPGYLVLPRPRWTRSPWAGTSLWSSSRGCPCPQHRGGRT
mgnify:CR=1 FL=1